MSTPENTASQSAALEGEVLPGPAQPHPLAETLGQVAGDVGKAQQASRIGAIAALNLVEGQKTTHGALGEIHNAVTTSGHNVTEAVNRVGDTVQEGQDKLSRGIAGVGLAVADLASTLQPKTPRMLTLPEQQARIDAFEARFEEWPKKTKFASQNPPQPPVEPEGT